MQHRRQTPFLLSVCLAAATAAAAEPNSAFDGTYSGMMTQGPGGLTYDQSAPACEENRPAQAVIRNGYVYFTYHDWHRHLIHYKGRVTADSAVSAYHRNRDGSATRLTGNVNGNSLTADTWRGRCDYAFSLTKG